MSSPKSTIPGVVGLSVDRGAVAPRVRAVALEQLTHKVLRRRDRLEEGRVVTLHSSDVVAGVDRRQVRIFPGTLHVPTPFCFEREKGAERERGKDREGEKERERKRGREREGEKERERERKRGREREGEKER